MDESSWDAERVNSGPSGKSSQRARGQTEARCARESGNQLCKLKVGGERGSRTVVLKLWALTPW